MHHKHRQSLKQTALSVSAKHSSSSSSKDSADAKGKVEEVKLKTPNVLHFADPVGSAGVVLLPLYLTHILVSLSNAEVSTSSRLAVD